MAQIVGVAGSALHVGAVRLQRCVGGLAGLPERFESKHVLVQAGEGIEQPAVRGGVDQSALVVLAVDLDQGCADRFQRLHRGGLVVDEGAGTAVGKLHAAQNHLAGVFKAVGGENRQRGMALREVEHRRDLALFDAVADEPGIAAATQRQRESIEKNGFTCAGLAGQHRQTAGKLDIEPFDQDDVTDRKTGQHGGLVPNRGQIA